MARDDDFGHWNRPVKLVGVSGRRGLNAFGSYDVPEPAPLQAMVTELSNATTQQTSGVQQISVQTANALQAAPEESSVQAPAFSQALATRGGQNASAFTSNAVAMRPPTVAATGNHALTVAMRPVAVGGERRGLFYEDLGSLARYPPGLQPLKVVRDDVGRLMAGQDYALQMQLHIEHHEQCIYSFDQLGGTFHLQSALGHREVHQWLAGVLYDRLAQELAANVLPAVDTIRFLKIPTRPPLQEVLTHFHGCDVNDCVWSYRKGQFGNDLTRNTLLIVVFATSSDARNADVIFHQDPWFADLRATFAPMMTSKKDPSNEPNWSFFNLCRELRCNLLKAVAMNCLLADPARRMTRNIQMALEEKAAKGLLSIGNSLNKNSRPTSSAFKAQAPRAASLPLPPAMQASSVARAVQAPLATELPNPIAVGRQRQPSVLKPASRPQADDRQAIILRDIISTALKSFFEATVKAHPCRIWDSEAMVRMLKDAVLRHPPLKEFIVDQLDAAGQRGNELRNLLTSRNTTVLYGTAMQRELPVFTKPKEYDGAIRGRRKVSYILCLDNVERVCDALQSPIFVAVSLRANPGFTPSVRLLSLAMEDRAFVIDLHNCPVEDDRMQAMLSALLATKAFLCFETQREVLRFRSLCNAQTADAFEARLRRDDGFTDPFRVLQKCSLAPVWQPDGEAMLSLRYNELELYTVSYLGALLNTAYDTYLYCVNLTGSVYEEAVLRAVAIAMLLHRCRNEVPDMWAKMTP